MSFEIQNHGNFHLLRLLAAVNGDELAALAAEVRALEAALPVTPDRVLDLTSVEDLNINFASVLKVVEKLRARSLANPVKTAVIARRPFEIGFARMFQSLNDHPQIEIRIVESLEAAKRWFAGERERVNAAADMTLFVRLVDASARVSGVSSRSAKVRELAEVVRALEPDEMGIGVQYLSGEIRQGRLGLNRVLWKAKSETEPADSPAVSVTQVDDALTALDSIRGSGSNKQRSAVLRDLFARLTAVEGDFLQRLVVGELRQGALGGVMVDAIAEAANAPVAAIRRAAMYAKDLGVVARAAMSNGVEALLQFQLEVMSPIAPMLAQTAAHVGEALEQLGGEAAFEWKMDGARIQVHKIDAEVRIYTRNLNDVTAAIPEIAEAVTEIPFRAAILDGEAIALTDEGRPRPFQTTMRRFGRKLDVEKLREELPIQGFFFDCLRLEGESLADRPARERFAALARIVPQSLRIPQLITSSVSEAQAFQEAALAAGHEGVMAKALDAPYEAGNRGASWLKIKRVRTLDLVVLAAEWGHGRRTGKLSNLHLGALDPATGGYVMLGKTFKGLTDAMLDWQTQALLERETHRDKLTVYVRPELVVEIAFSDLQASPRYPGGLALRLARVKGYRSDKRLEEADTIDAVRRIFEGQK